MEDQAIVEDVHPQRMGDGFGEHVEKIFTETEIISRDNRIIAAAKPRPGGDDRRKLGDQPNGRPVVILHVFDIAPGIIHAERSNRRLERVHWMTLLRQTLHEITNGILQSPMMGDILLPTL